MAQADLSVILTGVFGIATVVIGAQLQKTQQQNLKLREALNDRKQKFYFEMLRFLDALIEDKFKGDAIESTKDMMRELVYFAPTNVVKGFGDFMQNIYATDKADDEQDKKARNMKTLKLYAELKVQIRRDLGNAKRSESWMDIQRLTTHDIHEYVPKSFHMDRGKRTRPQMIVGDKKIR